MMPKTLGKLASMVDLSRKHALVTGGSGGIGTAVAIALANAGATVTLCSRNKEKLLEVSERSPRLHAIQADVTDEKSIQSLYDQAKNLNGPFDIVIANAGAAESASAEKTGPEIWNRMIAVNLTGAFLTVRPAISELREKSYGRIIFIASTAGLKGYPYVSAYCAAKHGVVGLARALAAELARSAITVNAICPGFTQTPLLQASVERIVKTTGRSAAEAEAMLLASNPQKRFINPEEIAAAVMWLCDERSGSITGQSISVSGGET